MDDRDHGAFVRLFDDLATAKLHKFYREEERASAQRVYWDHLRRHSLAQVQRAAEKLRDSDGKFPTSSAWSAAVPRQLRADVPLLSWAEADAYDQARALAYEREPCTCPPCVAAGVSEYPQRYLPEEDMATGDARQAQHPRTFQLVYPGHWAHGQETAGWYLAREAFYAEAKRRLGITRADVAAMRT